VVDAPGGGGKIPLMPQYMISRSDHKIILRNYEGFVSAYTEPDIIQEKCELCEEMKKKGAESIGIEKLFTGEAATLKPVDSVREKRKERMKRQFHA